MNVTTRSAQMLMPEQALGLADLGPAVKQPGAERVAQRARGQLLVTESLLPPRRELVQRVHRGRQQVVPLLVLRVRNHARDDRYEVVGDLDAPRVAAVLRFTDSDSQTLEVHIGEHHALEFAGTHARAREELDEVCIPFARAHLDDLPGLRVVLRVVELLCAHPVDKRAYLFEVVELRGRGNVLDARAQEHSYLPRLGWAIEFSCVEQTVDKRHRLLSNCVGGVVVLDHPEDQALGVSDREVSQSSLEVEAGAVELRGLRLHALLDVELAGTQCSSLADQQRDGILERLDALRSRPVGSAQLLGVAVGVSLSVEPVTKRPCNDLAILHDLGSPLPLATAVHGRDVGELALGFARLASCCHAARYTRYSCGRSRSAAAAFERRLFSRSCGTPGRIRTCDIRLRRASRTRRTGVTATTRIRVACGFAGACTAEDVHASGSTRRPTARRFGALLYTYRARAAARRVVRGGVHGLSLNSRRARRCAVTRSSPFCIPSVGVSHQPSEPERAVRSPGRGVSRCAWRAVRNRRWNLIRPRAAGTYTNALCVGLPSIDSKHGAGGRRHRQNACSSRSTSTNPGGTHGRI